MAADTLVVLERHEDVVVDLGAGPPAVDLGVDGAGRAEQTDRLIDQMGPEVEQEPAGLLGVAAFAPRLRAYLGRHRSNRDSNRTIGPSASSRAAGGPSGSPRPIGGSGRP